MLTQLSNLTTYSQERILSGGDGLLLVRLLLHSLILPLEELAGFEAFAGFFVLGFKLQNFVEEHDCAFEVFFVEVADAEVAEDETVVPRQGECTFEQNHAFLFLAKMKV